MALIDSSMTCACMKWITQPDCQVSYSWLLKPVLGLNIMEEGPAPLRPLLSQAFSSATLAEGASLVDRQQAKEEVSDAAIDADIQEGLGCS